MFPSNQALSARPRRRRRRAARGMNRARSIQAIPSNQVARVGRNSGRRRRPNRAQLRNIELIPSAVINRSQTQTPSFSARGGNVVVTHREYFRTLSADVAEAFSGELINPCNPNLFPWLCMVAPSWERYRFQALTFSFKTSCSTTFAGDLAMAIDYDARDALPTTFGEISSHEGCCTGNFYGNLGCPAIIKNFDKRNRGWYLSAEAEQSTELAEFYGGTFETYTSVATANAPVGKLYVDYIVELNNPQPRDNNGFSEVSMPSELTMNIGAKLLGNYITQGGTVNITGNEVTATTDGIKFLNAGDFLMELANTTVTDAAVITKGLVSANGIATVLTTAHPPSEDYYNQTIKLTGIQKGDTIDWVVSAANMVTTVIMAYIARYKTSNY